VAKRGDSRYVAGRSPRWLKLRVDRAAELAVVGFAAARVAQRFGTFTRGLGRGAFVYAGGWAAASTSASSSA
jgi:ATP-dependent DNA ligase